MPRGLLVGKALVMAEPRLQPMHKGKESQIYSQRLACGLLEGGSARQEMQIKRGYSGLGRRRERKAPQKRWQSLKRSLKSNAVEGAESQPLCQSPSRWEAASWWRGFCLAVVYLSVKHGSVLGRARGRCRARSHRACQAAHCRRSYPEQRRDQERSMGDEGLREDTAARKAGKSS